MIFFDISIIIRSIGINTISAIESITKQAIYIIIGIKIIDKTKLLAVGYWAAVNRCTYEDVEDLPAGSSGLQVTAHRYRGGTGGSEVWLYEIHGGSHSWSEDVMDTGFEIWKFFSMYVSE